MPTNKNQTFLALLCVEVCFLRAIFFAACFLPFDFNIIPPTIEKNIAKSSFAHCADFGIARFCIATFHHLTLLGVLLTVGYVFD